MREYELTVVYDLAVAEAGGADASVQHLSQVVESRGGKVLKVDHWGRRRLAYPIGRALDGDYVVSRVEIEPAAVNALEATLRIDERVYRHLVVRADELPPPPPPREPRQQPGAVVQAEAPETAAREAVEEEAPQAAVVEESTATAEAPAIETPAASEDQPEAATPEDEPSA